MIGSDAGRIRIFNANHEGAQMRMQVRKLAALLGVMTVLGIAVAAPSGAATQATVTPNPVPVSNGQDSATVQVQYNFGTSNTAVFFDICKKLSTDPTFDYTTDCDRGASDGANGSQSGTGQFQMEIPIGDSFGSRLFGDNIDQWGCYPQGFTPSAGFQAASQCYLRVTQTDIFNNTDAKDIPLTYSVGGDDIPEVPVVVMPVVLGAVAVGGYLLINRRRALA